MHHPLLWAADALFTSCVLPHRHNYHVAGPGLQTGGAGCCNWGYLVNSLYPLSLHTYGLCT